MHFNKPHWEILTPGRTGSTLIHRLIQNCYFLKNLKRLKFYDFDQINTDILQEVIRNKDVIVHDHHVHFYPYYRNNNFNLVISIRDIEEIIYSRLMFEQLAAYETKIWHYYSTDKVPTIKPFVADLNEIDTLYGHIKFFCEKINEQIKENDEVCFLDYADFYQNPNSLTEFFGFGKLDFSRIEKKIIRKSANKK